MKTQIEVPVSMLYKKSGNVIYFDLDQLEDPDRVEHAYLLVETNNSVHEHSLQCFLNDCMSYEEWSNIRHEPQMMLAKSYHVPVTCIDITEDFQQLLAGTVINNGFTIISDGTYCGECRLRLIYREQHIIPNFCNGGYFDTQFILSSRRGLATSPWILTQYSKVISFYVKNNSDHPIVICLQNSPNAKDVHKDAQRVSVAPHETAFITPYAFSKYTRILVSSVQNHISARVWFETQMIT